MSQKEQQEAYEQIDSHREALDKKVKFFDPKNPGKLYNQPRQDLENAPILKQTYEEGAENAEGWLHYRMNRLDAMRIVDGQVALRKVYFPSQTESTYGAAKEEGLWQFADSTLIEKGQSPTEIYPGAQELSEGMASPKYHDKIVQTVVLDHVQGLDTAGVVWRDVTSVDSIYRLIDEIAADCDPSVIRALYMYTLQILGWEMPTRITIPTEPTDPSMSVDDMQPWTPNWFDWRTVEDEQGNVIQTCVQGRETFAVAFTKSGNIVFESEKSPAAAGHRYITAVSGGWKHTKVPSPVDNALQELRQEAGYVGERAALLGVMHPNPDSQTTASVVTVVANAEVVGKEGGDEMTETLPVELTESEFIQAIQSGKIVDDRTIAAVCMGLAHRMVHQEFFVARRN